MDRNVALYPWFRFAQNLLFWQAVWFLYFQAELSAGEAILLYALYELATTILEVPSGYASDRLGRRITLIVATACGVGAASLQIIGGHFVIFALAQVLLGGFQALTSGTDGALLYESLAAEGREDETEAQELKAWRFGFAALALSALAGGLLSRVDFTLAYVATAIAFAVATLIALRFEEPPHAARSVSLRADLSDLGQALLRPVLLWLFVIFLLAHIYSHLPFVFGQPFIREVLAGLGLEAETPIVSGAIVTSMMLISLLASAAAPGLRARLGLGVLLLASFAVQIAISAAMALSGATVIILVLLARMIPSSFQGPFITARIQPELPDSIRATFVSLKSLSGRLIFAGTLAISSTFAGDADTLPLPVIQNVLGLYVLAGLLAFLALAVTVRRAGLDE
ncbi:MAG: MFS transporter [Pseudomonadota bacterium]